MKKIYLFSIFLSGLFISSNPVLSQTINNLNNNTFTENSSPIVIDSDVSVSGGGGYGGGYVLFDLTNGSVGDQLGLVSDANPNAAGAISYSGGNLYLGNGVGKDVIGSIDATLNGQNGTDLKINFTSHFSNSSFENGLEPWIVGTQMVKLGVTSIADYVTPVDPTNPSNSGGDGVAPSSANYNYEISSAVYSEGIKSLRLYSTMTTSTGCDVVHGPYVYSNPFQSSAGDVIYFDWRAYAGNDAYDVFGYILNTSTGATTIVLNKTGTFSYDGGNYNTDWATASVTIPATDSYRFVFVSGTYDATCGRAAGASLYIDNVRVYGEKANDAVVTNIMRRITYQNNCGTSSATRNLQVSVKNNVNATGSANSSIALFTYPPVIHTKNISVNLNASGQATIAPTDLNNGSTDTCPLTFAASKTTFDCDDSGANQVILTATDSYGNSSAAIATVTVNDNLAPVISCPSNIVVNTDPNSCSAAVTVPVPTVTDNCSLLAATGLNLVTNGNFTNGSAGWNACGNNNVEVHVETIYGGYDASNNTAEIDPHATTDTSDDMILCQNISGLTIGETYQLKFIASKRTFSGSPSTVGAIVTVDGDVDGDALNVSVVRSNTTFAWTQETFSFVAKKTTHLLSFKPTSQWGVGLGLIVDNISICQLEKKLVNSFNGTSNASGTYNKGTTHVTWTFTDGSSNTASCNFTVTVNDLQLPTINCPSDITVANDMDKCSAVVTFTVTSSDNCPGQVITQTAGLPSGATFPIGSTTNTFVVTDASGKSVTKSFVVTVNDTQPPNAIAKNITIQLDASGNASITAKDVNNGSDDNCAISSMNLSQSDFTCDDISGEAGFALDFNKSQGRINLGNLNYINEGSPGEYTVEMWVYLRSYNPEHTYLFGDERNANKGVLFEVSPTGYVTSYYPYTRENSTFLVPLNTWTHVALVQDASGISVYGNGNFIQTIDMPAQIETYESTYIGAFTTDNVNFSRVADGMIDELRVWNTARSSQDILSSFNHTLNGNEPSLYAYYQFDEGNGSSSTADATGNNPDGILQNLDVNNDWTTSTPLPNLGKNIILTVTDVNGNSSTATAIVTVADNIIPTFTRPADKTIYTNAACLYDVSVANTGDVTNEWDNCSSTLQSTYADAIVNGNCEGTHIVTRKWSLVDNSGNHAADQFQTITILDNTAPTFTRPADVTLYKSALCAVVDSPAGAAGDVTNEADNCSTGLNATFTDVKVVNCEGTYTITRTWSLVDNCSNAAANQVQTITVLDKIAPTFTRPADVILYKDANCNVNDLPIGLAGDVTNEADNCSTGLNATFTDVKVVNCEGTYTITRTWSLVDKCDNAAANQVQTITILDNTAPTFNHPADVTLYKDASCFVNDLPTGSAGDVINEADNCSTGLNATFTDVKVVNCQGTYTITRTWSLVDKCGNAAANQVQTITVLDNTAPAFNRPADVTLYKDASCFVDDLPSGLAGDVINEADNCSTGLNATFTDVKVVNCQGTYTITRTWSLVDKCGNAAANQVQTITVIDNTAPTFTRPADVTLFKDAGCFVNDLPTGLAGDVTNEADNCSTGLNATFTDVKVVNCQGTYTITRTWSLVDKCGNAAADQVQIITVKDNTVPTFTRPADITIYKDASCAVNDSSTGLAGDVTNEADNCSTGLNATYSDVKVDNCQGTYTITRTWSLVDNCGNKAADQVQIITVKDNTVPTFTRPADVTLYKSALCAVVDSPAGAAGDVTNEADNCSTGLDATYIDSKVDNCQGTYTITRTWSLVDKCGNAAADQVQVITVKDNTAPTFTRPADVTLYKSALCAVDDSPSGAAGDATNEADNCSTGLNATYSDVVVNNCQGTYTITRTWSLVDNCGNAATNQVQIITVLDKIAPTFTRPADVTLFKDASCFVNDLPTGFAGDVTNEADNCSTVLNATFADVKVVNCEGTYTITRTWSLVDKCGNAAANQVQTITVKDVIKPVARCKNISKTLGLDGTVTIYENEVNNGSTDNCTIDGNLIFDTDITTFDCTKIGPNNVVLTVTDGCGNSSTCNAAVTILPLTATTTVSASPNPLQYSDRVTFTATVTPATVTGGCVAAQFVTFFVGTQQMGNPVPVVNGSASEIYLLLEVPTFPANGQMAPGNHTVTAKFSGINAAFNVPDATNSLTITPEDARVNFTGTQLVATQSSTSGLATVTLRATVQDITAATGDPAYDSFAGDIRNARVKFTIDGMDLTGWLTPTLINSTDLKTGVVTYNWDVNINSSPYEVYTIGIIVDEYYIRNNAADNTVVTVYKPVGDFITGGGYILPAMTAGTYAADPGLKTNFGFNVGYNKSGKNIHGNMNIIFRKTVGGIVHTFQIKANAMTSLGVDISNPAGQVAIFVSKANLKDITNPLAPVSLGGNLTLQVNLTDKGEPGSSDQIAISLYDGSILLYSSNWTGMQTGEILLAGGNILVHSGFSLGSVPAATAFNTGKKSAEIATGVDPEFNYSDLKVYPNPFSDRVRFEFVSPDAVNAQIYIYDMAGRRIETVFEGPVEGGVINKVDFIPRSIANGMYMYRMILGKTVYDGKIEYKK